MRGSESPWIKLGDFSETSYWLTLTNTTTQTKLKNQADIELTEISESGLTLRIPMTACALGHHLSIQILRSRNNPFEKSPPSLDNQQIDVTAKVTELERLGKAMNLVTVQFYQFNEKQWAGFLKEYAKRQSDVDQVFKKIQE